MLVTGLGDVWVGELELVYRVSEGVLMVRNYLANSRVVMVPIIMRDLIIGSRGRGYWLELGLGLLIL